MNARASVSWSSMSTPTNCTRPRYSLETVASSGASRVQGPHHEAQTFTTIGVPRSSVRSRWNFAGSNSGSAIGVAGRRLEAADPVDFGALGPPLPAQAAATMASRRARATKDGPRARILRETFMLTLSGMLGGEGAGNARSAANGRVMILENALLPGVLMAARLDAPTLRRAMSLFAESLRGHRDELNSLNVYPVPDGDTGTNLLLTQEAVERALATAADGNGLPELCRAIARSSLMGARGNSGVILSQILRGLCQVLSTDGSGGPRELDVALQHGSDEAYRAVARPVEGTVLTVLRDAAGAANGAATSGASLEAVAAAALKAARASLARTRDALPELR